MSNSVLDHLAESDQSETDSMVRMGEEIPKGKRIHLRDVLAAVGQESPVKPDQSEQSNDTQINSRKRRMVKNSRFVEFFCRIEKLKLRMHARI